MDEKKYTLEDIETLREKTGVGYGEAVRLLEKYDGDIAKALVELEKRGEIGGKFFLNGKAVDKNAAKGLLSKWWERGYKTRVIIEHQGEQLINLSALFIILAVILGWKVCVVGAILALLLGCHVRVVLPEAEKTAEPEAEKTEEEPQAEKKDSDGYDSITIE